MKKVVFFVFFIFFSQKHQKSCKNMFFHVFCQKSSKNIEKIVFWWKQGKPHRSVPTAVFCWRLTKTDKKTCGCHQISAKMHYNTSFVKNIEKTCESMWNATETALNIEITRESVLKATLTEVALISLRLIFNTTMLFVEVSGGRSRRVWWKTN